MCLSLVDRSETFYCSIKIESCDMGIFASSLDWQKLRLQSGTVCSDIHSFLLKWVITGVHHFGKSVPEDRGDSGARGRTGAEGVGGRLKLPRTAGGRDKRCAGLGRRWPMASPPESILVPVIMSRRARGGEAA